MTDETQMDSVAQTNEASEGTIQDGISNQSQTGQPYDLVESQADYTRKTQALADERRAFEAEKQAWQARQTHNNFQGYSSYQQPVNQGYSVYNQPVQNQYNDDQELIDQFGYEGAKVIKNREQAYKQQTIAAQINTYYELEQIKGINKYGKDWEKHNYFDHSTGQMKNKVVDLEMSINPLTLQRLTLDQAWNALNPVDAKSISEQAKQAAYQEMNIKESRRPISTPNSVPTNNVRGNASTMEQALDQAIDELKIVW